MVPCLSPQARHDIPSCCHPAWRHSHFHTYSRQTPRLGVGPRALNVAPKHQPPLRDTSVPLYHSCLFFQLDCTAASRTPGMSGTNPAQPMFTAQLRFRLQGKEPQGIPQPWPAAWGCGSKHRRRKPPPPWVRAAHIVQHAPCTASTASGLDKPQPSEGCVHHR